MSSNCTFYEKIGACRHGDKCSRRHIKPMRSRTVMLQNFYQNPDLLETKPSSELIRKEFINFYKDLFIEAVLQGGEVTDVCICENANDHLNGNVYIKFATERQAENIVRNFNGRYFDNRPVFAELSPVRNFNQSVCKQHYLNNCTRGDLCNFMHEKRPIKGLFEELYAGQYKYLKKNERDSSRFPRDSRDSRDSRGYYR